MDTPKVVLDALFPQGVTVAGLKLRPIKFAHYLALQRFENPLAGENADLVTGAELLQALYILHLPPLEVFELDDKTLEAAANEMASRIDLGDMKGIAKVLADHIKAGYATAPKAGQKVGPDGSPDPFAVTPRRRGLAGFVSYWRGIAAAILGR